MNAGLCIHVEDIGTGKVNSILQGQKGKNIPEFYSASFFLSFFFVCELCKVIIYLNRKAWSYVSIVYFLEIFFCLRGNGDYYCLKNTHSATIVIISVCGSEIYLIDIVQNCKF